MKVVNKNKVLLIGIISLIMVNMCLLIYQKYTDKETNIPKVKLKDQEEKKDTFAIMLQQDDGTYQATESTSFNQPGYEFNSEKSGCIDVDGNKIDNALSYNETTKAVVVNVDSTAYCYVYFDLQNDGATQLIDSGVLWTSGLEGDGYRYIGNYSTTNPANYICFGTTNKDTCTGNTDAYMYRIIGVFPDSEGKQHMKLIKKEALNTGIDWNDDRTDIAWGNNTLYKKLNDTEAGSTVYLKNSTYMPADGTKNWSDRITNWTWSAVDTKTYPGPDYSGGVTAKQIYLHELNRNGKVSGGEWTTPSGKIGLMYVSDYALSLGSTLIDTEPSYANRAKFIKSWMHISNNDTGAPGTWEWTMSRSYEPATAGNTGYSVRDEGAILGFGMGNGTTAAVRPVFYLNSNQAISSGSGTLSDPYILK